MDVDQFDVVAAFGTTSDHVVVRLEHSHAFGPARQAGVDRVAVVICRVVNVREEKMTAAGESLAQAIQHRLQPFLEIGDPRLSLFERRSVHRTLARRRAAIVVDDVVAAGRQHDDTERLRIKLRDFGKHKVDMLQRRRTRQAEVLGFEVWQDRRQAEAAHVGELIVGILHQPIEKRMSRRRSVTGGNAVSEAEQDGLSIRPRLTERFACDGWSSRSQSERSAQPVVSVDENGHDQRQPDCHQHHHAAVSRSRRSFAGERRWRHRDRLRHHSSEFAFGCSESFCSRRVCFRS